jgi:hypothetical protein
MLQAADGEAGPAPHTGKKNLAPALFACASLDGAGLCFTDPTQMPGLPRGLYRPRNRNWNILCSGRLDPVDPDGGLRGLLIVFHRQTVSQEFLILLSWKDIYC